MLFCISGATSLTAAWPPNNEWQHLLSFIVVAHFLVVLMYFECMSQGPDVYLYVWRYIWTLDPCLTNLCFDINSCFLATTMPPSPPPTISAHDQQAANCAAGLPVVPAKATSTSRKRQQSNADELVTKHNKTLGMRVMMVLLWRRWMMQRKKQRRGRKGRKLGPRGKRSIYFIFGQLCLFQLTHHLQ